MSENVPSSDPTDPRDLTIALAAAERGDAGAAERLLPLVYDELRALARARMAGVPPGQTLQPTALVHEAFLRVADRREGGWDGRAHFFYAAARAMRDILVEEARRKGRRKRGGDRRRVDLETDEASEAIALEAPDEDMIGLDQALDRFEADHPDHAHIVMLRYFTGLTADETADVLGASRSTVERSWRFARAWLRREMNAEGGDEHADR